MTLQTDRGHQPAASTPHRLRIALLTAIFALAATAPSFGQDSAAASLDSDLAPRAFDPCAALQRTNLFKPLSEIRVTQPEDEKRLPPDCSGSFFAKTKMGDEPRFASMTHYQWRATDFAHMPAYFDDVPLERYGQTRTPHWQPVISGTKFLLQVPALPYKMGIDRPHACITTLGHRPPGDCVPCIKQRLPLSGKGSAVEAAAAVGLIFLLP